MIKHKLNTQGTVPISMEDLSMIQRLHVIGQLDGRPFKALRGEELASLLQEAPPLADVLDDASFGAYSWSQRPRHLYRAAADQYAASKALVEILERSWPDACLQPEVIAVRNALAKADGQQVAAASK
jgi:hypothetical protein